MSKRTTIRLDEGLLADAKEYALRTGQTLTGLIEESLRESLARRREGGQRRKVSLPTDGAGGLQPGVDLDDGAALLDLMEADED